MHRNLHINVKVSLNLKKLNQQLKKSGQMFLNVCSYVNPKKKKNYRWNRPRYELTNTLVKGCGDLYQYLFDSKVNISTKSVTKFMTTIHSAIKKCSKMESMWT